MRMGHKNVADGFTACGTQDGRQMASIIRTGVHNGNLATPHNETVGAFERERAGIVAGDPPKQGRASRCSAAAEVSNLDGDYPG